MDHSLTPPPLAMEQREGDTVMEAGRRAQRMSVLQDKVVKYSFDGCEYEMTPDMARKLFTPEDIDIQIGTLEKDMEIVRTITDRYVYQLEEALNEEVAVARKLYPDREI